MNDILIKYVVPWPFPDCFAYVCLIHIFEIKKLQFKDGKDYKWAKWKPQEGQREPSPRTTEITSILDSNGQELTDQDEILKRIEASYEQLNNSDTQTEESKKSNEAMPNATDWQVKHAVNHMARGKAPGPDNIKDGNVIINKELILSMHT